MFVISRVRKIEHLDLTNFRENNQNVRYIEVQLIINLQNPVLPGPAAFETQEQANKTVSPRPPLYFILFDLFGIHLLSHVYIYSLYRDTIIFKIALLDCVRLYNEDFVKSRFCPGGRGGGLPF